MNRNHQIAAAAAAITVVAGIVAATAYRGLYALTWVAVIAGAGALYVLFAGRLTPQVTLPGSRGTLLLLAGLAAAIFSVLTFLSATSIVFVDFDVPDMLFLLTIAASLVLAWVSWQEFQAEGGKFQLGTPAGGSTATGAAPPPPAAPDQAAAAQPPAAPPVAAAPPAAPSEPPSSMAPSPAAPPSAPAEPATPPEPPRDETRNP